MLFFFSALLSISWVGGIFESSGVKVSRVPLYPFYYWARYLQMLLRTWPAGVIGVGVGWPLMGLHMGSRGTRTTTTAREGGGADNDDRRRLNRKDRDKERKDKGRTKERERALIHHISFED